MTTKVKSENTFLKKIASHLGYKTIKDADFFNDCEAILGQGGASNYFVYCSDNKDFLNTNKTLIQSKVLELFASLGESPRTYNYTLFGQPVDEDTVVEILAFLYGLKLPEQGQGCDWIVWCAVESEVFNREEEIATRKWS
jgi:hypothetical protein